MRDQDAQTQLTAAVERFRAEGDAKALAQALREQGEVERRLTNLPDAQAAYEEAVALCRQFNEPRRLAHWIRHLGDVHLAAQQPESALETCKEALAIYRTLPNAPPGDVANAVRSAALAHVACGLHTAALGLFREAADRYDALSLPEGRTEMTRRADESSARAAHS